jgi:uncharacterized protein YegL
MSELPGGEMAHRPLHFLWLLDCSSSMTMNGKITSLNFAMRECLPEMRRVAASNPAATLEVRVITFSTGAQWHKADAVPIDRFSWEDVTAQGVTDLGEAFLLAAEQLDTPPMPERALRPVLALVSDGQPTDDWRSGLRELDATPWGKRALRLAIAIGDDADHDVLNEFLNNPELKPYTTQNAHQLSAAIRWASTVVVRSASRPTNAANPLVPPVSELPDSEPGADDDGDVW